MVWSEKLGYIYLDAISPDKEDIDNEPIILRSGRVLCKAILYNIAGNVMEETGENGSEMICKMATDYTGIQVKQMLFEEFDDRNQYDGIWACASILHLSREKLPDIFHKMHQALKTNGIIYASFKYGTFEGERNGRSDADGLFLKFVKKQPITQMESVF